jgi:hypothetical protein
MYVLVRVFQHFVLVRMGVIFSQVQPHPQAHQPGSSPERQ